MTDGDFLLKNLQEYGDILDVAIFARHLPAISIASVLIWAIAVGTVLTASVWIGKRDSSKPVVEKRRQRAAIVAEAHARGADTTSEDGESIYSEAEENLDSIDITPMAAVGFIILASGILVLFFYVNMLLLVEIVYLIGATLSIAIVFIYPGIERALASLEESSIGSPSAYEFDQHLDEADDESLVRHYTSLVHASTYV